MDKRILYKKALKVGDLRLFKYLYKYRGRIYNTYDKALIYAAKKGHLDIVEYLHDNGSYISNDAMINAATYGHLDIVIYLYNKIFNFEGNEYPQVVKYLYRDLQYSIRNAAENGHFDIVKFLVEKGGLVEDNAIKYAKTKEIRDYLIKHKK